MIRPLGIAVQEAQRVVEPHRPGCVGHRQPARAQRFISTCTSVTTAPSHVRGESVTLLSLS
ncbi:hypothetical protein [Streptomyces lavendulae]|uniref:hypothetical protein n=1 Tax=Streptomyces lavendulae TaxID=1914 RepID=UPI0024A155DD|nr:hypothetical protein [Streptomyces lavendulae]GLW03434.1 hypothetical protein Slala05_70640 [Streptomyces lavendulae subsp. lavendulae]